MVTGIIEAAPEVFYEPAAMPPQAAEDPAAIVRGAVVDNEAPRLYPGLVPNSKTALAALTRFLNASVTTSADRLAFRAGAVGHDLVVYPTNPSTVVAFIELALGGKGLFTLAYQ